MNLCPLSKSLKKIRIYSADTEFRQTYDLLDRFLGRLGLSEFALTYGLTFIKPDAFAFGKALPYLNILRERGFEIAHCERRRLDLSCMRAIWRYQWNIASLDRLFVLSRLNSATDIILVLIRAPLSKLVVPVSVQLAQQKGSANPNKRSQSHIREVLQCPNVIFSAIHVSDEPADVIRELGIFFSPEGVLSLLEGLTDRTTESSLEFQCRQLSQVPAMKFDATESARRVLERLPNSVCSATVLKKIEAVARGDTIRKISDWRQFVGKLAYDGVELPLWDELVLASQLIVADVPNQKQRVDSTEGLWR